MREKREKTDGQEISRSREGGLNKIKEQVQRE